jgi:hypothetical protein
MQSSSKQIGKGFDGLRLIDHRDWKP